MRRPCWMACGPLTLSEAQGSWGGGPVGEYGLLQLTVYLPWRYDPPPTTGGEFTSLPVWEPGSTIPPPPRDCHRSGIYQSTSLPVYQSTSLPVYLLKRFVSRNCHLHLRMLAIALLCESYQLPRAARPAHRPVWTATGHPYRSRTMLLSSTSNTLCAPPPDATKALAFAHGEAASDG